MQSAGESSQSRRPVDSFPRPAQRRADPPRRSRRKGRGGRRRRSGGFDHFRSCRRACLALTRATLSYESGFYFYTVFYFFSCSPPAPSRSISFALAFCGPRVESQVEPSRDVVGGGDDWWSAIKPDGVGRGNCARGGGPVGCVVGLRRASNFDKFRF